MPRLRLSLSLLLLALAVLVPLGVAMHTHARGGEAACPVCAIGHLVHFGDIAPALLVASLPAVTLVFAERSFPPALRPAAAPLVRGPPASLL